MPTLSSLLPAISFFFLFNLPPSILCTDDYRFSNCSQEFGCGPFNSISYPFWSSGIQPEYCGRTGFQLQCEYGIPTIQIMSQQYRVVEIKPESQTLIIARNDVWKGNCVTGLYDHNTLLDHTVFNLSDSANQNLTLFYHCPSSLPFPNKFQCEIFGNTGDAWISSDAHLIDMYRELLNECKYEIGVPVLRTGLSVFNPKEQKIEDVLKVGFEVKYSVNVSICEGCENSGGRCGFNSTTQEDTCFCRDGPNQLGCKPKPDGITPTPGMRTKVAIGIGAAGGTLIVVAICCLMGNSYTFIWKRSTENAANVEAFLKDCGPLPLTRYKYSDVKKLANSFEDKIGQGGYGNVYKGMLTDGRMVAIKILSETKGNGTEFINEVASISKTSHVNIVSLLGFCIEEKKRALIYEFMPNGSLEKFIYDEAPSNLHPPLGWETLYKISIGIARGLDYLHRGCNTRIVHFDIKPHNILLDQNFCPKISDFGLSKLGRQEQSTLSMTGARGTPGYIAPELVSRTFGGVSH